MSLPIGIDLPTTATALIAITAGKVVTLDGNGKVIVTTATTDVPLGITLEPCDAGELPIVAAPNQEITVIGTFTGLTFGTQLGGTAAGAFADMDAIDVKSITPASPLWVVGTITRVISQYSARITTTIRAINGTTAT
jgi:hypothetical protein